MNDDILKYWIALKSIPGVGNVIFPALVDKFGSLPAVFAASVSQLNEISGISRETAKAIAGFNGWDKVKVELELVAKNHINIITYHDDLYPEKLLNIYDRPPYIYVRGNLNKADVNIAIVGSRLASTYGKYTTERISRELALKGVTVVSGMARGIDSAAHRGAMSAHGRTLAVLGSGLDVIYPPENKKLYADIVQNGAVISEYPLGTPPRSSNFPARNRIISGMSYGVVIVEAGEKSGSLITARLALEQGREVFAVPGSIDSAGSRGTNKLIKQGAKLIENTDDILEEILPQIERSNVLKPVCASASEDILDENIESLSVPEQKIIGFVSKKRLHIDDLISLSGLPSADTLSALTTLELKGFIQQHPGKFFSKNKQEN
jgi:DNA processing protein